MEINGEWWKLMEYAGMILWTLDNCEYQGRWWNMRGLQQIRSFFLASLWTPILYIYMYVKYLYIYTHTYIYIYLCMSFVSSLCTHERCFYSPSVSRWLFDSRIRLWVEVIAAKEFWRTDGLGWQDHAMARNTSYKCIPKTSRFDTVMALYQI